MVVAPGDIFLLRSAGRLADIGAAGGVFGHVVVATSQPQRICKGTQEADSLRPIWPEDCEEVWRVATIESTRREQGLHESDCIFAVEAGMGTVALVGECSRQGELSAVDCCELVVLWQAPSELRGLVSPGIVQEVVAEMKAKMREANWSMLTAARAAFQDASLGIDEGDAGALEGIQACWRNGPICTSVAIICWQRCLCCAAAAEGGGAEMAVDLIMRWMPLKADRALPSDLVCTLLATGWRLVEQVGETDPYYRPRFADLCAWPSGRFHAALAGEVKNGGTVSL